MPFSIHASKMSSEATEQKGELVEANEIKTVVAI